MTETDEVREIRFTPGFHECHTDPSKNYGIGCVRMTWTLKHGGWAMTWDVSTDWGMTDDAFRSACRDCTHPMHVNGYPSRGKPSGGAVDWHSPVPLFDDQEPTSNECKLVDGPCYLDSGFILADMVLATLRDEGDEAVWAELRRLLDERRAEVLEIAPTS